MIFKIKETIKVKKESLEKMMMEVGQGLYNDPSQATESSPSSSPENDNVIDTDFTE